VLCLPQLDGAASVLDDVGDVPTAIYESRCECVQVYLLHPACNDDLVMPVSPSVSASNFLDAAGVTAATRESFVLLRQAVRKLSTCEA